MGRYSNEYLSHEREYLYWKKVDTVCNCDTQHWGSNVCGDRQIPRAHWATSLDKWMTLGFSYGPYFKKE